MAAVGMVCVTITAYKLFTDYAWPCFIGTISTQFWGLIHRTLGAARWTVDHIHGGSRGIRTPGAVTPNSLANCPHKPLEHTSKATPHGVASFQIRVTRTFLTLMYGSTCFSHVCRMI